MAGIYIHVPYCKTKCIYCDFFSQTNSLSQSAYVQSLCNEIALRKTYLDNEPVKTIYFGGGTPSQLSLDEFKSIFGAIYAAFEVEENAEITIEANPDDLSEQYISQLVTLPINRISIGIQSFEDRELKFLKRRHSAQQAKDVVRLCQRSGYNNISIDLIYGLPDQTMDIWKKNIEEAMQLNVQHISAYHLIYEEGTKLYKLFTHGDVKAVDEEVSVDMFSYMMDRLGNEGFEHYEISNFAKPNFHSRHNSSYWLGDKYLGLGPAAHSFDGIHRAWNISSISKYIDGINKGSPNIEIEEADKKSRYNDFILTGMRTKWGVSLTHLEKLFGQAMLEYCLKNAQKYIHQGVVIREKDTLTLSKEGIFISDGIMSDLMWV